MLFRSIGLAKHGELKSIMKIKQLIEELSEFDPDMDVILRGYEGGYYEPNAVVQHRVVTNVHNEWYYGPHEDEDDVCCADAPEDNKKTCVLIS